MNDIIATIASQAGLDTLQTQQGLGAVLSSLQQHVPDDVFSQLASAIPGSGQLMAQFRNLPQSGGPGQQFASAASALFGGTSDITSTLASSLGSAGFSLDAAGRFIPVVLSVIKGSLSPTIMQQMTGAVPALAGLMSSGGDAQSLASTLKKLL